jgi:hypothetical protein
LHGMSSRYVFKSEAIFLPPVTSRKRRG